MPHSPASLAPRGPTIGSVEKAVHLLKLLGNGPPARPGSAERAGEAGVSELARQLRVHKSTVSRLLVTLERGGLVERDPRTEKYRLGFELVRLAGQVRQDGELSELARGDLQGLAEASGETVNLALPDDGQVINVQQISSHHLVKDTNWVGRRTPYHCAANGKALLAWQPEDEITRILPARLERFTPSTITTRKNLLADLAKARERGYAVALEELEIGLIAIAGPVRDAQGQVVAAISVSGPSYRITRERIPDLGQLTMAAAERISKRLGWIGN